MVKSTASCLVDTNVPKIANQHLDIKAIPDNMLECVLACVERIQAIIDGKMRLVLDEGGDIFDEYRRQLSISGQPGIGDKFMKWIHDNQWASCDRVNVTKTSTGYAEFPQTDMLRKFDKSDMKFVATANAHPDKPLISVALDRGWWRHKSALKSNGIQIDFLCPAQAQQSDNRTKKAN